MADPGSPASALPSSSVHWHVLTRCALSIDLQVPCAIPWRTGPRILSRHPNVTRVRGPGAHDVRCEPRPIRPVRPVLHARRHAVRGRRERERLPVQLWVRERGGRGARERVQLDVSATSWRRERVLRWSANCWLPKPHKDTHHGVLTLFSKEEYLQHRTQHSELPVLISNDSTGTDRKGKRFLLPSKASSQ